MYCISVSVCVCVFCGNEHSYALKHESSLLHADTDIVYVLCLTTNGRVFIHFDRPLEFNWSSQTTFTVPVLSACTKAVLVGS